MPDYTQGKIYKVWDNAYTECYIGSTVETLSSRMAKHRAQYKRWKANQAKFLTAFLLFDKFGVENCKVELLEHFPRACRSELEAREGYHHRQHDCVNKQIAGRSHKEYLIEHREPIRNQRKGYYLRNKDALSVWQKQYRQHNKIKVQQTLHEWYDANRTAHNEKQREYYTQHREQVLDRLNKKVMCPICMSSCSRCNILRHQRTQKHQNALQARSSVETQTSQNGMIEINR